MSSVGLYGFEIPHDFVQPTRDMVTIRIPFPPRKIGNIITPEQSRELMAHNVMTGRIVAMGPLAFSYKDGDGLKRQEINVGDWVMIRPFAGTMVQGGSVMVTSGYRYVSSFNDVIGVIPSDRMPDPATLVWDEENVHDKPAVLAQPLAPDVGVRERVVYKK